MEGDRNQRQLASSNSLKENSASKAEGEPDALAAAGSSASRRAPSNEGMGGKGTQHRETSEESASSNASPKHTKEQEEAAQTILKCKDYYEVLGLTKTCTDEDLRKTYRKLALKFHPDKNHAPSATEAFKLINNAYNVLTDPGEKRRYDSSENERNATQMPRTAQDQQQGENFPWFTLLAVVVAGWILWKLWPKPGPAYKLQRNAKYVIRRTTKHLSVQYFVESDFISYYRDKIAEIEAEVEEKFLDSLL